MYTRTELLVHFVLTSMAWRYTWRVGPGRRFHSRPVPLFDHPRSGVVYSYGRVLSVCMYVCLSDDNFRDP